MKKYIFSLILSFTLYSSAFALDFYSETSNRYILNDGEKTLSPITIKATWNGEIKKESGLTILIWEDMRIRFNNKILSGITITWNAKDKVDFIEILPNLTSLAIRLKQDLIIWDEIILGNVWITVFDRAQWKRSFWMDTNGDSVPDFSDSNTIEVVDTDQRTDYISPNEVFSLTGSIDNSGTVSLSWLNPGDLDFNGVKIEFLDINRLIVKDDFVSATWYALVPNDRTEYLLVKTNDRRWNTSNGKELKIDDFKQVSISSTGATSSTWIVSIPTTSSGTTETPSVMKTEKIFFSFKNPRFSVFSFRLDYLLDKKITMLGETVREKLLVIRNSIVQTLLDYEANLIGKTEAITKLSRLIGEFNGVR